MTRKTSITLVTLLFLLTGAVSSDSFSQDIRDRSRDRARDKARDKAKQKPLPKNLLISVKSKFRLSQEEVSDLKVAFEILNRNPKMIPSFVDPSFYKQAYSYFSSGDYKKLIQLDRNGSARVDGQERKFMSRLYSLRALGMAERASKDKQNLFRIYEKLYFAMTDKARMGYISPKTFLTMVPLKAIDYMRFFVRSMTLSNVRPIPSKLVRLRTCREEQGSVFTERADFPQKCQSLNDYAELGIMRDRTNLRLMPMKWSNSCIKDQANRNTCVAFAMNSAKETKLFRERGIMYNFSEQYTYAFAKAFTGPWDLDGLLPSAVDNAMMDQGFYYYTEDFWAYNPSFRRTQSQNPNAVFPYQSSCMNYNGVCSDLSGQNQLQARRGGTFEITWQRGPFTNAWHALRGTSLYLFDWSSNPTAANVLQAKRTAVDAAILLLRSGEPLVIGVNTSNAPNATFVPDQNGYVPTQDNNQNGHAMHAIGYVENRYLPKEAPTGAGGGYFVFKNSWGMRSGDCGYVYLSYDYVLRNLIAIDYQ